MVPVRLSAQHLAADAAGPHLLLSPRTTDRAVAERWFASTGGDLDGIVAKRLDEPYEPGKRVMVKVKRQRTADCVVGGYRTDAKGGKSIVRSGVGPQAIERRSLERQITLSAGVLPGHNMGDVAADARRRLVDGDLVIAVEAVGRGQSRDPGADDRDPHRSSAT